MKLKDIKNKELYLKRQISGLTKDQKMVVNATEILKDRRIDVFKRKMKIMRLEELIKAESI